MLSVLWRRRLTVAPWVFLALVALALRLGFVLGVDQTPVLSDSLTYDQAGQAVAGWMGPQLPRLIRGVFHWQPDVLRDLAGDMSTDIMVKGPTYPLFLGFIYLFCGHHYVAVRLVQAIVDVCTTLLVGALGCKVGNTRSGWIAAALYATYQPMILMVGRLMQETLILFLLALLLWLLCRGIEADRPVPRGRLVLAGAVLGAVLVGRPALQYLFILLVPAYALARALQARRNLREIGPVLCGALIPVMPAMVLLTILTGRVSINGALAFKHEKDLFFGVHPSSRGWVPDIPNAPGESMPPPSLSVPDVGRGQTYLEALKSYLLKHPLAPLKMGLRRAYLFYALPSAEWLEQYLLPRSILVVWHKGLVILGLLGAACALGHWRRILPILAVALYVLGVALAAQTQTRFAIPALVAWTPLAGLGVARLGEAIGREWTRSRSARGLTLGILAGVSLLASPLLQVPCVLAIAPSLDPLDALHLSWSLKAMVLVLVLFGLDRVLVSRPGITSIRVGLGIAGAVLSSVVVAHDLDGGSWREWKATLESPRLGIEQIFRLPRTLGRIESARLLVDVDPALSSGEVVRIRFGDGTPVLLSGEALGGDCFRRYLAEAGERWQGGYYVLQHYRSLDPARMRKWLEVRLPAPPRLGEPFRVTLDLPQGGSLGIFGDFLSRRGPEELEIPTLDACDINLMTSFWKFFNDHDYRIRQKLPLRRESVGAWREGSRQQFRDLSPDVGVQSGSFRLFLVLQRADGTRVVVS